MKFVIASDIHGSAYWCRLFRDCVAREQPDKVILLGDLLYHGARNPLPPEYGTLQTAEILNSMKDKLLCVAGNCDSDVDKGDVLFNGHFHVPAFEERENCTYVNCGSVSIPKEGSPHSYLVLEGTRLLFKEVGTGKLFLERAL